MKTKPTQLQEKKNRKKHKKKKQRKYKNTQNTLPSERKGATEPSDHF